MFTGIIEATGEVAEIKTDRQNKHFAIKSPISNQLKVDQSLAHDGVCLTVTQMEDDLHWVTAVDETLQKSNLGEWTVGTRINLERSMPANGRFDGHIVQGHVDGTAVCTSVEEEGGSWLYTFAFQGEGEIMVEKGSITVNGISLTCFNIQEGSFQVAIIPYTYEHTNLKQVKPGMKINLEFDIVGKYITKLYKYNPSRL